MYQLNMGKPILQPLLGNALFKRYYSESGQNSEVIHMASQHYAASTIALVLMY